MGVVKMNGMGSHQSHAMGKDEWLTPPEIIKELGPFDLDPCAPIDRPWPTANQHYTLNDMGLLQPWFGKVWCNPPYGAEAVHWLNRLVDHGNGIALIFARTETKMFWDCVWTKATALLFIKDRLHFYHVDGTRADANSGAPSVLIAYGNENANRLHQSKIRGAFIDCWKTEREYS